jgi:hypothetical protein
VNRYSRERTRPSSVSVVSKPPDKCRAEVTLVSGSGDSTVRLWDTEPLRVSYQASREASALRTEAERLVEQLWRQKNNADEIVAAIRADRALAESLRHAALRAVLRRALPAEAVPGKEHGHP